MRREGIGCLLKMSLVSVLLENSPGRVSTSRDFFPLFPSSRAGIRKRSYHPNINSWKNGGEEGGRSTRRRWGCAIGRNRSRNTRISFRNLEGVCVCVHGAVRLENMHLHGASASLHAPASSLTLQEFLLAWKIPLPNFPPPIGRKQFDPTHAGEQDRMPSLSKEQGNETYLLQTCSFLIFLLLSSSSIMDDFMRCWILKCRILDRVSRAYGGKIDFRLFWETIRGEYRSIDISARDNSWRIGSVGSIDVLVEI